MQNPWLFPDVFTSWHTVRGVSQRSAFLLLLGAVGTAAAAANHAETARALIAQLQGSAPDLQKKAADALTEASQLRTKGQASYADMKEEVALEWAEAATSLAKAQKTEEQARALEVRLSEAETRLSRARALLEQEAARRSRAQAALAALENNQPTPTEGTPKPEAP